MYLWAWTREAGLTHGPRILDGVFGKTPLHKNADSFCKTRQSEKDRPLVHIKVAAETSTFRGLLGVTTGGHHHDGIPGKARVAFEFAQHVYAAQPGQLYIKENKRRNARRMLATTRSLANAGQRLRSVAAPAKRAHDSLLPQTGFDEFGMTVIGLSEKYIN